MNKKVNEVINALKDSIENKNMKLVQLILSDLDYMDEYGMSWLHLLVDEKADEKTTLQAIKILLNLGINPNKKDNCGYNFIQVAMYTGYSESFIYNCIEYALNYNLKVNHVDFDKDTMIHTAIESKKFKGKITNIYNLLNKHGYNSLLQNTEYNTIMDCMHKSDKYSKKYKNEFLDLVINNIKRR